LVFLSCFIFPDTKIAVNPISDTMTIQKIVDQLKLKLFGQRIGKVIKATNMMA